MGQQDGVEGRLVELAEPIAAGLGLALVDLRLRRSGRTGVLTVTIDRDGGVTLDDCQRMSRALEDELDALGLISGPYRLEVESPGIDRVLRSEREYRHFAGREVEVSTYAPQEGRRRFVGTLVGYEDGALVLDEGGQRRVFPREQVAKVRLHVRL